jgi:hypothetical protein
MTLCGEGPVVSRRDSVPISLSCEWRALEQPTRVRFRTAELVVRRGLLMRLGVPVGLTQHPDEHRPERPILLAVDQELGDARVAVGTADDLLLAGDLCRLARRAHPPP